MPTTDIGLNSEHRPGAIKRSQWGRLSALAIALSLVLGASAHPLDLGRIDLLVNGSEALLSVEFNPSQAARALGVSRDRLADAQTRLLLSGVAGLSFDGAHCAEVGAPQVTVTSETVRVAWALRCGAPARKDLALSLPFLAEASPTLQLVGQAHLPHGDVPITLSPAQPTLRLTVQSGLGVLDFISLGIHHIGAAPGEWHGAGGWHFPEGIDHILFLLALVLGGGSLKQLLATVTGFTLGHSVTLALASLGLITLPSRWVESAIAFSIVYVALEDVLRRGAGHRWVVASGFGLVHGFGFASAVREVGLSGSGLVKALVGFNLGVELGQAGIVLVLAPLLVWLRRDGPAARGVQRALAVVVLLIALRWLVQRLFMR